MKHWKILFFLLLLLPSTASLLAQCGQTIEGNTGTDSLEFDVISGDYWLNVYFHDVPDSMILVIGNQPPQIMCVGDYCVGGPLATGESLNLQDCAKGPVLWENGFGPIQKTWDEIVAEGYVPPVSVFDTGGVALVKFTIPPDICRATVKVVSNPGNTVWAYRLVCPEGLPTPPDTVLMETTTCILDSVGTQVIHTFTDNGCPIDSVTTVDYAPLETEVGTTTCDSGSVGSFVNTFITEAGCDSIVTTVVSFIDTCNTVTEDTGCVYIPNAFSPNDDGINDVFMIFAGSDCLTKVRSFIVFSRWGESVFQYFDFPPNDQAYGWDGYCRGKLMDTAVFAWFAEVEFVDGSVKLFKGDVTLVR